MELPGRRKRPQRRFMAVIQKNTLRVGVANRMLGQRETEAHDQLL